MQQLPLFPELDVNPKARTLTEIECLELIERQLKLSQRRACKWYLDQLWQRARP